MNLIRDNSKVDSILKFIQNCTISEPSTSKNANSKFSKIVKGYINIRTLSTKKIKFPNLWKFNLKLFEFELHFV